MNSFNFPNKYFSDSLINIFKNESRKEKCFLDELDYTKKKSKKNEIDIHLEKKFDLSEMKKQEQKRKKKDKTSSQKKNISKIKILKKKIHFPKQKKKNKNNKPKSGLRKQISDQEFIQFFQKTKNNNSYIKNSEIKNKNIIINQEKIKSKSLIKGDYIIIKQPEKILDKKKEKILDKKKEKNFSLLKEKKKMNYEYEKNFESYSEEKDDNKLDNFFSNNEKKLNFDENFFKTINIKKTDEKFENSNLEFSLKSEISEITKFWAFGKIDNIINGNFNQKIKKNNFVKIYFKNGIENLREFENKENQFIQNNKEENYIFKLNVKNAIFIKQNEFCSNFVIIDNY